ncbi:MAG: hypothetical protein GX944_00505 [Alphaproteobacteria bacterium]|nr:hypothetical protein [Alphaproteobacteria bacterium]
MKKIYAIKLVNGKPTTIHEFRNKEALISYASSKIYEEATNTLTINELIKTIGLERIYSKEVKKFNKLYKDGKIGWLVHLTPFNF